MKSTGPRHPATRRGFRTNLVVWVGVGILVAILALMGAGMIVSHQDSRKRTVDDFQADGKTSAGFISTFVSQQARKEQASAKRFLSSRTGFSDEFVRTVVRFGSGAGVLLDSKGRLLAVVPRDPSILGKEIASRYPHLRGAERGHVSVSGLVSSAAKGDPVIGIAVPYATSSGRRVFSVAYRISGTVLGSFIDHTTSAKGHKVLLVDSNGNVIAHSSRRDAATLAESSPALAAAVAKGPLGSVTIAGKASTYQVQAIPGTPWRLIVAVPDSQLFASIGGGTEWLRWVTLILIALLGSGALIMLARARAASARARVLSAQLERTARTDPLTGLPNRRAQEEEMDRAIAAARRRGTQLSVLMVDVDSFKQINDSYGHAVGDRALCVVAGSMRSVLRDSDALGRWGGDEFLAILPGLPEEAVLAAERLCAEVATVDISDLGVPHPLSVSVGCASGVDLAADALISEADTALLAAKRAGRDRISTISRPDGPNGSMTIETDRA